jgi:ADP-ribose pyrophosphatase
MCGEMRKTKHKWKGLSLVEETLTLPNQKTIVHTSIHHPGAAVILTLTDKGDIVLLRQYRPSIKSWVLELPAGTLEKDENPLEGAKRELQEETGYTSTHWQEFGIMLPLVGFCDEKQHLFVVKNAVLSHATNLDDDEMIEVMLFSLQQIENAISKGDIVDSKTISVIYKAKLTGLLS